MTIRIIGSAPRLESSFSNRSAVHIYKRNYSIENPFSRFAFNNTELNTIQSVQDALTFISELKKRENEHNATQDKTLLYHPKAPPTPFPFGIWFRGHEDISYDLVPSVYRGFSNKEIENKKGWFHDETSITRLFILSNPEHRVKHHSTFEWLSLMQHYRTPTRLLDWTESILVALYFITSNPSMDNKDGALWVLNAKRLNKLSRLYLSNESIADPANFDVVVRAEMSRVNDIDSLLKKEALLRNDERDAPFDDSNTRKSVPNLMEEFKEDVVIRRKLSMPIAVYPLRISDRLIAQSGVFTLHGGKSYYKTEYIDDYANNDKLESKYLPPPIHLIQLHDEKENGVDTPKVKRLPFLSMIAIEKEFKSAIRTQLMELGIHQGSIYAELDDKSSFIKQQWTKQLLSKKA